MSNEHKQQSIFSQRFPTFHRLAMRFRSPRFLGRLGIAIASVITLIALYFAYENWQGARAWKAVRNELQAQGEPLTFQELLPPMPPEDQNFAMTPLFKGIFDKSIDPKTGKEVWREKVDEFRLPDWFNHLEDSASWRFGERQQIGWDEGASLRVKVGRAGIYANSPNALIRALMDDSKAVMDEIQAAVRRPNSQFPVHYEDNFSALLPHLSKLKSLGRLFTLRALIELQAGEADAALRDVETTIALSESLRNEAILISGLVRTAILEIAMQPIWEGVNGGKWSDAQLAELQSKLQTIDLLKGYQLSMRGERVFNMALVDYVEDTRKIESIEGYGPQVELRDVLYDYAPKGWYLLNKAELARINLELMLPTIDPHQRLYHPEKVTAYQDQVFHQIIGHRKMFLAQLVAPAVAGVAIKFVLGQTDANLAAVACALERYKIKNGHYPDALKNLEPEYMDAIPHDIMDGQPLRYQQQGSGFALYSVGENSSDDGGKPGFKQNRNGRSWRRDKGDWVWMTPEVAAR
ncbi:hypothetical protein GC207_03375 [bacterium]|nr:hypothetical protein [bacterium]